MEKVNHANSTQKKLKRLYSWDTMYISEQETLPGIKRDITERERTCYIKRAQQLNNRASKPCKTQTIEMQVKIGIFTPRIGDFNTHLSVRCEVSA